MKGVTSLFHGERGSSKVSIHTPNEGSDSMRGLDGSGFIQFQSTLPMKGVTQGSICLAPLSSFQSTLPMKGVTCRVRDAGRRIRVSIHTPNEGSDTTPEDALERAIMFQSTLPMKGVTLGIRLLLMMIYVSIHTPNEGSDQMSNRSPGFMAPTFQSTLPMKGVTYGLAQFVPELVFQSTLPMKGVTFWMTVISTRSWCFNPHSQ